MEANTGNFLHRSACPVCTSPAGHSLLNEPLNRGFVRNYLEHYYGGRATLDKLDAMLELVLCQGCGLIYQRSVPNGALLADIYDRWIPPTEQQTLHRNSTLDTYRYLAWQVDYLIQQLRKRPAEIDVLDFGMGWAEWASMARAYGCNVYGAELSQERIAHAKSIGIPVVPWEQLPDRQFDFIATEQVFEHLTQPREVLQYLVRSLKPGGLLKISVPDGRGMRRAIEKIDGKSWDVDGLNPVAPLEHINCFEYRSVVALGKQAGLRAVRPAIARIYNASAGWMSPRGALRNLLRPLYRHVYPKSTFVYFVRAD